MSPASSSSGRAAGRPSSRSRTAGAIEGLPGSQGFTLIELLIVVVLLGLLAAIAVNVIDAKGSAYRAQLQSDIRYLRLSQEEYLASNGEYAPSFNLLDFDVSEFTVVNMETAGAGNGYSIRVFHELQPEIRCAVYMGEVNPIFKPAEEEGVIACEPKTGGGAVSPPGGGGPGGGGPGGGGG